MANLDPEGVTVANDDSSKNNEPSPRWSTLSVHGGEEREKASSALTDPIFLASTYSFADTQSLIDYIVEKQPREEYARYGNPTEKAVERKLAVLEGAEDAVLYSAGMTAIAGLLLGRLSSGDELVLVNECYLRTRDFLPAGTLAVRHCHTAGPAVRLQGAGRCDHARHAIAVLRIAHESALERDRPGAVYGNCEAARRGDRG